MPGVTMGPVISAGHRDRVLGYIDKGVGEGAQAAASMAARRRVEDRPNGYFVGPTVFDDVSTKMAIGRDEIFGPVASICPVKTLDDAIAMMQHASERQRDVDLHVQRQGGARVREARDRVDGRRQHRRRGADGVFPVRRRQGQFLRRPQGARPRRHRVLHRQEGDDLTVVLGDSRLQTSEFQMQTTIEDSDSI